jgi:probable rRNA maturation factor
VRQISNKIAVQIADGVVAVPRAASLRRWARAALGAAERTGSLCIRVVDATEMAELNKRFRHREGTTNVLSFAADTDFPGGGEPLLGDVVICAPVVALEAVVQHKTAADHYAHLVVHGVLHLCGYDHEKPRDAKVMESHEVAILRTIGIADPYRTGASLGHE